MQIGLRKNVLVLGAVALVLWTRSEGWGFEPQNVPVPSAEGVWVARIPPNQWKTCCEEFQAPAVTYTLTVRDPSEPFISGFSGDVPSSIAVEYEGVLVVQGFYPTPISEFSSGEPIHRCTRTFATPDDNPGQLTTFLLGSSRGTATMSFAMEAVGRNRYPGQPINLNPAPPGREVVEEILDGRVRMSYFAANPQVTPDDEVPYCAGSDFGLAYIADDRERDLRFRRVATGGDLEGSGTLTGIVRSSQPTLTETEREVQRATISLYRHRTGAVRPRRELESLPDYAAYVMAQERDLVQEITIEPNGDGTYPFGGPGRFEFEDVPLLQPFRRGGQMLSYYTVEVRNAATDEQRLDEDGFPIPDRYDPLYFGTGYGTNVLPESDEVEIELDPLDGVGGKQVMVDRLSGICMADYKPVEDQAATYLQQIRDGITELTEQRDEGIRRSIWAERTVGTAVVLSDELLKTSLQGFGNVLADAFGDLVNFEGGRLSRAKARQKRIEDSGGVPPGVPPGPIPARRLQLAADDAQMVKTAEMAGQASTLLSALKPIVLFTLKAGGVVDAQAENIASKAATFAGAVGNGIKSGSLQGLAKSLIQDLIKTIVNASRPLFLDLYCFDTSDELQTSVTQMQGWSTIDDEAYATDRGKVLERIRGINAEASAALANSAVALELAGGLSSVQSGAAFIGAFVPWVRGVEKGARASKYLMNLRGAVEPMVEVYLNLPPKVGAGVSEAFGIEPASLSRRAAAAVPLSLASTTTPDPGAYVAALEAVAAALESNDLGAALEAATGEQAGNLLQARAEWERDTARLLFQSSAILPTADALAMDAQTTFVEASDDRGDFRVVEARLWSAFSDLVVDAFSDRFVDENDPLYLAARNAVLVEIDTAIRLHALLEPTLDALAGILSAVDATPAVVAEPVSLVSDMTGGEAVSLGDETFTLSVRVANVSSVPLDQLTAKLTLTDPEGAYDVPSSDEVSVGGGMLAANDGTSGEGADEAVVEFSIHYGGDLSGERLLATVDILEDGVAPSTFVARPAEAFLGVDPDVADSDLDQMPDAWEVAAGLDPTIDDRDGDGDEDGATNFTEYLERTDAGDDDSDDDGLSDGEELSAGADGFLTDPLDADTDDDDTPDGADGAPLDAQSTTSPGPPDEPVVEVDRTLIGVSADQPAVAIAISNAGAGTLVWSAEADNPDLVLVSPTAPNVSTSDRLLVTFAPGFVQPEAGVVETRVRVIDAGGAVPDEVEITVLAGGVVDGYNCGDADGSGDAMNGADVTAGDALKALQAAVGALACETCRCDVNVSGSVSAGDALLILRAAVGQPVQLLCASC